MKLWKKHGTQPRFTRLPEDFDAVVEAGFAFAGGPATVREQVGVVVEAAGANYFIAQFSFGDLAHEQALRSARLFVEHVMAGSGAPFAPETPSSESKYRSLTSTPFRDQPTNATRIPPPGLKPSASCRVIAPQVAQRQNAPRDQGPPLADRGRAPWDRPNGPNDRLSSSPASRWAAPSDVIGQLK